MNMKLDGKKISPSWIKEFDFNTYELLNKYKKEMMNSDNTKTPKFSKAMHD